MKSRMFLHILGKNSDNPGQNALGPLDPRAPLQCCLLLHSARYDLCDQHWIGGVGVCSSLLARKWPNYFGRDCLNFGLVYAGKLLIL